MPSYPLVFHSSPDQTIAWRDGAPVPCASFSPTSRGSPMRCPKADIYSTSARDRYRFTVSLCATLVAGKTSLLPSTHTPEIVRALASFAPDAFCLHDNDDCAIDLPRFRYPEPARLAERRACAANRRVAHHRVRVHVGLHRRAGAASQDLGLSGENVRAAAARLGLLDDGRAHAHRHRAAAAHVRLRIDGAARAARRPRVQQPRSRSIRPISAPSSTRRARSRACSSLRRSICARCSRAEHALPPRVARAVGDRAARGKARARSRSAPRRAADEIYGSTETGQIATRRTAQTPTWRLFSGVASTPRGDDADGPTSGHPAATSKCRCRWATRSNSRRYAFSAARTQGRSRQYRGQAHVARISESSVERDSRRDDGVFFMPDERRRETVHASRSRSSSRRGCPPPSCSARCASASTPRSCRVRCCSSIRCRATRPASCRARSLTHVERTVGRRQARAGEARVDDLHRYDRRRPSRASPAISPAARSCRASCCSITRSARSVPRWNDLLGTCRIGSAKFLSPAAPGETLALTYETPHERRDPLLDSRGLRARAARSACIDNAARSRTSRDNRDRLGRRARNAATCALLRFMTWVSLRFGRRIGASCCDLVAPISCCSRPTQRGVARLSESRARPPCGLARHVSARVHVRVDDPRPHLSDERALRSVRYPAARRAVLSTPRSRDGHGVVPDGRASRQLRGRARDSAAAQPHMRVVVTMYEENARNINATLAAVNPAAKPDVIGLGKFDAMLKVRERLDENADRHPRGPHAACRMPAHRCSGSTFSARRPRSRSARCIWRRC